MSGAAIGGGVAGAVVVILGLLVVAAVIVVLRRQRRKHKRLRIPLELEGIALHMLFCGQVTVLVCTAEGGLSCSVGGYTVHALTMLASACQP